MNSIVLGLGFGDEGKGITTDFLVSKAEKPLVVRFNGGHQAGHTVALKDGKHHVFSTFGSGTLRGAPTYVSKYCVFSPFAAKNEFEVLTSKGVSPSIYIDPLAMVCTYYDVLYNRALEKNRNPHGSCGVGFGSTIERNLGPHKLYIQDLYYPFVLRTKLQTIKDYYAFMVQRDDNLQKTYSHLFNEHSERDYFDAIELCRAFMVCIDESIFDTPYDIIFEGAQGILLDEDFGFHPNTTWSHCTSRNAMEMVKRNSLSAPEIYYVTRAYQTRHGAGPMTNWDIKHNIHINPLETNTHNEYQTGFRKSILDLDLLHYAIACDGNYSRNLSHNLVMTCWDHVDDCMNSVKATIKGSITEFKTSTELALKILPWANSFIKSSSPISDFMATKRLLHKMDP